VVPESVTMIAAQVIGNDATITIAASREISSSTHAAGDCLQHRQSLELIGIAAATSRSTPSRVRGERGPVCARRST